MTRRLKNEIGLERLNYEIIKNGETHLKERYDELAKLTEKILTKRKMNYEIRKANKARK